jgi:cbb3-type cytochrome oxidase maturation protein
MNVLVVLVPLALGLGLAGLFAFMWTLKSGQYEDMEGAALRVLSDDDLAAFGKSSLRAGMTAATGLP